MSAIEQCTEALRDAWASCDHQARFEAWADLYYRRFHRLSPGKSEAIALGIDSSDDENRAQCDAWHSTGLAKHDAIMEVARLSAIVERLSARIEELEEPL